MTKFISTLSTLFAVLTCLSLPAHALSPLIGHRISTIFFTKNDFSLGSDATEELERHASCVNTISLEYIIVIAFGDGDPESSASAEEIKLAAYRAIEIRNFFIASGMPENRIYSEARLIRNAPTDYFFVAKGQRFEKAAVVETRGNCRSTTAGNDCRVLCNGN